MAQWRHMAIRIWVIIGSGNNIAWRHQAITLNSVRLSLVKPDDIYLNRFSQQIPQPSIIKIKLQITYLKFPSNLPGANELNKSGCLYS